MAVMDFLRFPPFPPLLLYGCGHYVALRKWITRQRLASPPLCRALRVCRTGLVTQRFLIAVFVLAMLCEAMAFQSYGIAPLAYVSPSAVNH